MFEKIKQTFENKLMNRVQNIRTEIWKYKAVSTKTLAIFDFNKHLTMNLLQHVASCNVKKDFLYLS